MNVAYLKKLITAESDFMRSGEWTLPWNNHKEILVRNSMSSRFMALKINCLLVSIDSGVGKRKSSRKKDGGATEGCKNGKKLAEGRMRRGRKKIERDGCNSWWTEGNGGSGY